MPHHPRLHSTITSHTLIPCQNFPFSLLASLLEPFMAPFMGTSYRHPKTGISTCRRIVRCTPTFDNRCIRFLNSSHHRSNHSLSRPLHSAIRPSTQVTSRAKTFSLKYTSHLAPRPSGEVINGGLCSLSLGSLGLFSRGVNRAFRRTVSLFSFLC